MISKVVTVLSALMFSFMFSLSLVFISNKIIAYGVSLHYTVHNTFSS